MICSKCGSNKILKNGIRHGKQNYICRECKSQKPPIESNEQKEKYTFSGNGDKAEITNITNRQVKTLQDLVEVCEIDLEAWAIERWVCNKWESFYKIGDGSAGHTKVPLYQVKAWLVKNRELVKIKDYKEQQIKEMQKFAPVYPKIKYQNHNSRLALEINLFDVHFGMLSWNAETGFDYDITIARQKVLKAVNFILNEAKHKKFEQIIFPVGNDFFNVDNKQGTTTNGTPQSEDTRWQKTFVMGRRLMVEVIDILSQLAPVYVPVVPGNHDFEKSFHLGDSLYCWYSNNPQVEVNNEPRLRKYYRFGKCLIAYTHGKDEKIDKLPTTMAIEAPKEYAATKFREWHIGHVHHQKRIRTIAIDENEGVAVRSMRNLAPIDSWHYQKGYVGTVHAGEGFIWDKENGMVNHITAAV